MKYRIAQTVLLFAAGIASASAADWRHVATPPTRPVDASDFMIAADGALWTFSFDGVRRTDTGGAVSPPLAHPSSGYLPDFGSGLPLADGGAILVASDLSCSITRVDAGPRRVWQETTGRPCAWAAATPAGRVWLADHEYLTLYAESGRTLRRVRLGEPSYTRAVRIGLAADGGASVATTSSENGGGAVTRYDLYGAPEWTWAHDALFAERVFATPDGTTIVVGLVREPLYTIGNLNVYALSKTGAVRWHYATTGRLEYFRDAFVDADGAVQVLMETDRASTLYRIAATGTLAWRNETCASGSVRSDLSQMARLPGGDIALACPGTEGARYQRIDAGGRTLADTTLPTVNARPIRTRADGKVQVRGHDAVGVSASRLYAIDVDGKVADVPGASPSAPRGQSLAAQYLAPDGTSYLLARPSYVSVPDGLVLTKIDANGARAWQRTLTDNLSFVQMSSGGGVFCLGGYGFSTTGAQTSEIRCYDDADGASRWSKTLPQNAGGESTKMTPPPGPPDIDWYRVLDDGSLVTLQGGAAAHAFVRYGTTGAELVRVNGAGGIRSASISATGQAVASLRTASGSAALVRYDRDGNAKPIGASVGAPGAFDLVDGSAADDGSVRVIARAASIPPEPVPRERELWSIGADGNVAWKRPYETTYAQAAITTAANAVYLVETQNARGVGEPEIVRVQAYARADGATRGMLEDALALPGGGGAFAVSGDVAVVAAGQRERLRLVRHDARTLAPLDETFLACNDYCGPVRALALDADGTARSALDIADRALGASVGVIARSGVGKAAPNIRIDQPGIAGAWWAPYANGEGFALDYLPASRTFFMPWFTFTRDGGNDASQQRWYVVQGAVAAGATQAELAITETTGGEFDAGPPAQARRVGTAIVSFTDCDNGTLRYAFDDGVNDGATGTITLSRLGAALAGCVLADGTTRPGTGVTLPASGFDARLSGSWFEPATSGQGLQFVVQPGGVFFAPWFTFRAARIPSPPLPSEQRWFTVQGSLASARDGVVELPIVRTLGGAFDSVPTNNMFAVGTAKLTILACDRATLEYRFDSGADNVDMFGSRGSIDLVKAGGCVP
jgi:hypothetical protein